MMASVSVAVVDIGHDMVNCFEFDGFCGFFVGVFVLGMVCPSGFDCLSETVVGGFATEGEGFFVADFVAVIFDDRVDRVGGVLVFV